MRVSGMNITACVLCVLAGMAMAGYAATAQSRSPVASASSGAKTAFRCKKKYNTAQGRAACFSQLPGASCAHPLEAEKAHNTTRGEHQYFKLDYRGESDEYGVSEHYSYKVVGKNLAMCPHGAILMVSRLSQELRCKKIVRNGHPTEECSSEYATKSLAEPVNAHGGSFEYYLSSEPIKVAHLVVKARFVHPPWASR